MLPCCNEWGVIPFIQPHYSISLQASYGLILHVPIQHYTRTCAVEETSLRKQTTETYFNMKALHLAHGKHFLFYFILIRILKIRIIHSRAVLEGGRNCVSRSNVIFLCKKAQYFFPGLKVCYILFRHTVRVLHDVSYMLYLR